jgi:beta-galactosidase/beta-glucuronidase
MDPHKYPRPLLQRPNWTNLNGAWQFAIDEHAQWTEPADVAWTQAIIVPYSPETPASGIGQSGYFKACWYQRTIETPKQAGQRVILHFGAVDWDCTVWVNGQLAMRHEGGYTPFKVDITSLLTGEQFQTISVRALDDPHDLAKPRGKQDWHEHSHSIWYPRTSGIWQTVWIETLSPNSISSLQWSCDRRHWQIGVEAEIDGPPRDDLKLSIKLSLMDKVLADDTYRVVDGVVNRQLQFPDPGIDAARDEYLWTPERPTLLTAVVTLRDQNGNIIDSVESYTAMRSVEVDHHCFLLNGRPYNLRMVLDQGYWAETGMTPPDDEALRRDVELIKSMKFNGVRKHQKIEDPRFLYWADRLGLLVWEEMPSAYSFTRKAIRRTEQTWMEAVERDRSHPCIVAWVPFNESWGLPDLPTSPEQRAFQKSIFYLTKSVDQSRPIVGNDGWEMVVTDILAVHDYSNPEEITRRFNVHYDTLKDTFNFERPGERVLLLEGLSHEGRPIMLTEFGGIALSSDKNSWGYKTATSPEDLSMRYGQLLRAVRALPILSGFCYTQLTDTYQEANGLLYMDRTPKFPISEIAQSTGGEPSQTFLELSQPKTLVRDRG